MTSNFDHISVLRDYFNSKNFHPKKHFGQNFLVDKNYIPLMIKAANLKSTDVVLEVGPGGGILTRALIKTGCQTVSVEIDNGLVDMADDLIGQHDNWQLVHSDVMEKKSQLNKTVLEALNLKEDENLVCIANLPYAIITPFLITLIQTIPQLTNITVLIQAEIGEKICSKPNTKIYGILSVIINTWGKPTIIKKVSPQAFWPQPKVTSSIVSITKSQKSLDIDYTAFGNFVKEMFIHRRKKITQNLKTFCPDPITFLESLDLHVDSRPENISPEKWLEIFQNLKLQ
ncbi:MAG: ribosomal RNA small subunit methyltransferase A [Planctomycetota bacterium]|nr:MAG: ribosomal RNA small subunit methyltransferase A [Planctomycetota bacterium]